MELSVYQVIEGSVLEKINSSLAMAMAQKAGLKPFPSSSQEVAALLSKENYDVEEVAHAIKKDPILVAKLLKMANSPLFRGANPLKEVEEAIIRLGGGTTLELVFAVIGEGYFSDRIGSGTIYRKHSLGCAGVLLALSRWTAPELSGGMFVCGLLHDLGKLVYLQLGEVLYKASLDGCQLRRAGELAREEQAKFGYDHGVLGGLLLEQWQLFPPLPSVIALHHQPIEHFHHQEVFIRAALLRLADAIEPAIATNDSEEFRSIFRQQHVLMRFLGETGCSLATTLTADKEAFEWLSSAHKAALTG